jgi:hypothetical protein
MRLQCRNEWTEGQGTLSQIAQRHSIARQTVIAWYRRENWTAARNKWIEAQRCDSAALHTHPEKPPLTSIVADADARVRRILRLEHQLESLDNILDNAKSADEWHKLSTARQRLFEQWRILSGIPLPGSRRQPAERKNTSPFEIMESPATSAATTPTASEVGYFEQE